MIERQDSLRDQAVRLIKNKIVMRELPFGSKLSVAELSREFGISNSPIREAISLLETDGLVVNKPNYGFHVIDFSEKSLSEVSECIKVIMVGCYFQCIHTGRTSALAALLEDRLEKQKSCGYADNTPEYAGIAIDFDKAFVDICENEMISKMFESKFSLLSMCVLFVYQDKVQTADRNLDEHITILEAVKSGDTNRVIEAISKHYDKSNISFG